MQLFFIVLIFCLFLFLFRLYHLAADDYVLVKKNISLHNLFDAVIVVSVVGLIFSRFLFVIFHPSHVFLSVLGFILFPYFPGLSLTGGLLGGALGLLIYSRNKKFPVGRVFDFFSVASLFSLIPGFLIFMALSHSFTSGNELRLVLYLAMFALSSFYIYPKSGSLQVKDGTVSILIIVFYSLVTMLGSAIDSPGIKSFLSNKENYVLLGTLLLGTSLIIREEIWGRLSL